MSDSDTKLDVDKWGRLIVWMCRWSWYDGKASGYCVYATAEEAIKDAIWNAMGNIKDWNNFPSHGSYPYEDRDGSNPSLTPLFRVTWNNNEGSGYSEAIKVEVASNFQAANLEAVNDIFQLIQSHKK